MRRLPVLDEDEKSLMLLGAGSYSAYCGDVVRRQGKFVLIANLEVRDLRHPDLHPRVSP